MVVIHGLEELGYVEGRNVQIEFRWAHGQYHRLPEMALDPINRRVNVITANTPANLVAKAATARMPIVFTTSSDPVAVGLVDSMSRTTGNVTGVSKLNVEVGPKRFELAHELRPSAKAVALLINPDNPQHEAILEAAKRAAVGLGAETRVTRAATEEQVETAFSNFSNLNAGVLTIGTDAFFNGQTARLAKLARQYRVPTIYEYNEFASAGGLISDGGSIRESYRLAGVYTARILKGEKPVDLPVQQSTKVELIGNLQTARSLGIENPSSLLARADEIIE